MADIAELIDRQGFVLVPGIAAAEEIEALKSLFSNADMARAERAGQTFGARNLLKLPEVERFSASSKLANYLRPLLGANFRATRGIFFDKTEGANWPVLWHQDLSLAVKEKCDLPGWTLWSLKRGVPHVQPPAGVLARMITVRLHLDDCPAENGALRVIPGSHQDGKLSRGLIQEMMSGKADTVTALAGDALLMRPLLLHASSAALLPHHRRVLHIEFAPADLLPPELDWAEGS
jgi:ectoine hydroxylase-related dioxygenase (phytanoyl-CoA dioxygenase family)